MTALYPADMSFYHPDYYQPGAYSAGSTLTLHPLLFVYPPALITRPKLHYYVTIATKTVETTEGL